ncbi:hypothetical protein LZC95_15745 [Pendulispora brunnea]|uniref:Cytochrome c domain-containing protein n=1 Tax=Pendulispora brunnea TaxID=2905690 RepID=A0ABZ2KIA1_9BACT
MPYLVTLTALANLHAGPAPQAGPGHAGPSHPPDGEELFDEETFAGNGRTCASCHRRDGRDVTDIDPEQVQRVYRHRPKDPLFRSIDSNDGKGNDYSLLLRDATFRIPFVLPPNVTVDERDDNVYQDAQGRTVVVLRRAVPSVRNITFEDHLMYDGRENADLAHQAIAAVQTHNEPGRLPTQREAEAMSAFQRTLFTSRQLERYAEGGPPPELPHGSTPAQRRGRRFFEQRNAPDGLCAMCHSGPLLNTTNVFNPIEGPNRRIAGNFSSELNANGYPAYTFHFEMPDHTVRTIRSPDPGRTIITGDPCIDDPAACTINPGSTASIFKIPTLWGVSNTAPYFHDNSAKTLEEMMVHYQRFFHITAVGLQNPDFEIDDQEASDIIAFLKLL